jgi:hypothetical protein
MKQDSDPQNWNKRNHWEDEIQWNSVEAVWEYGPSISLWQWPSGDAAADVFWPQMVAPGWPCGHMCWPHIRPGNSVTPVSSQKRNICWTAKFLLWLAPPSGLLVLKRIVSRDFWPLTLRNYPWATGSWLKPTHSLTVKDLFIPAPLTVDLSHMTLQRKLGSWVLLPTVWSTTLILPEVALTDF